MIGATEWWFEFTSLGISELSAEVQKEKLLFGTNDSNIEGDKQWATVVSPDKKCLCIKNNNSDGNTEGYPFGTSDDAKIGYCYIKMIGVTDYPGFG